MRIYVGNLSYRSSEQDVRKAFEALGDVSSARLAIDPQTGRSAGFAYIEMPDEQQALAAIARLNGKEINSRVVTVSHATVAEPSPPPERRERPGRSERPPRGARPGINDRSARNDRAGRNDRPEKPSRGEQRRHSEQPPRSGNLRPENKPRNVWESRRRKPPSDRT